MFCSKCGKESFDSFCPYCGAAMQTSPSEPVLQSVSSQPVAESQQPALGYPPFPAQAKPKSHRAVFIALGVVAVTLLAVAALFLLHPSKASNVAHAERFCNISAARLCKMLGTPDNQLTQEYEALNGKTYQADEYIFSVGDVYYFFDLVDDSVVSMKFTSGTLTTVDKDMVLSSMNITPSSTMQVYAESGFMELTDVNDKIPKLVVGNIDGIFIVVNFNEDSLS